MIKVIKHGQKEFEMTCSRCGCEFTYEYEDIHTEAIRGLTTNSTTTRYVICPDCGNKCFINDNSNSNIGWPWPSIGEPIPCNIPSDTALNPCVTCEWWKKMQQPGFTYVGDTPCTWCPKGPYRIMCGTETAVKGTTSTYTGNIGSYTVTADSVTNDYISSLTASTNELNKAEVKEPCNSSNSCLRSTEVFSNNNCCCKE